jgi:hypothetical protein
VITLDEGEPLGITLAFRQAKFLAGWTGRRGARMQEGVVLVGMLHDFEVQRLLDRERERHAEPN